MRSAANTEAFDHSNAARAAPIAPRHEQRSQPDSSLATVFRREQERGLDDEIPF